MLKGENESGLQPPPPPPQNYLTELFAPDKTWDSAGDEAREVAGVDWWEADGEAKSVNDEDVAELEVKDVVDWSSKFYNKR